jgi:hypothetical protein
MTSQSEQKPNLDSLDLDEILEKSGAAQFELSDEDKDWLRDKDVGREIISADNRDYRK